MSRSRERNRNGTKQERVGSADDGAACRPGRTAQRANGRRSWLADKGPILRFVIVFGLLLGGFNAVFYLWFSKGSLFESYLSFNARSSAAVLRALGDDAPVSGTLINGERFSLDIKRGCDAIQASAFFVLGVLASPAPVSLLSRVVPLLVGTLFLLVMNIVRIVSLYYIGVYFPDSFDVMHVDVWQALFIFLPLFLWVMWARWAGRSRPVKAYVSA